MNGPNISLPGLHSADNDAFGLPTARPRLPTPPEDDIHSRYEVLQAQYVEITRQLADLAKEIPDGVAYQEIANKLRKFPEHTLPVHNEVKFHFWQLDYEIKKVSTAFEKHKEEEALYKNNEQVYKNNEALRLVCIGQRHEARNHNKALNYMGLPLNIVPSVSGFFPPKDLPILDSYETVSRLNQAQWIQYFRFYYPGLGKLPDDMANSAPRDAMTKAICSAIGVDWAWNEKRLGGYDVPM
ncbi:uncharacterized protein LOC62_05G007502 [Vanrija pseudolonga]|uniref:Mug135-like C-terminal domain-containing protein n=1 Tax=Vanrija pseudolonga TaxID=143232 RepID=A0AAF0YG36_9TREE|nr:hypothetical protein LOC62_05G007502 [Vanrija pseudolonga]